MLQLVVKHLIKKQNYYSQYLQDMFLNVVFFNKSENGYFIDIGAYDGIKFSNSFYFEKNKKWIGIAIEPNKKIFEKLSVNRTCDLINGVISDTDGDVEYMRIEGEGEMLSGIVNNFADKHIDRISDAVKKFGGTQFIETVKSYSIKTILTQFKVDSISILSIDTEGSELQILKTFPFDTIRPRVILVENNFKNREFSDFLTLNGYHFCFRLGDDIYSSQPINRRIRFRIWVFSFLKKLKAFKSGY